ncbi:MAG: prolyl oligopeptidase family serine peptidase [Clostridia bacterium]|nr:prolyl oligopeptidase family serine peptidase [Clostridia bacterium]
MKRFFSLLLALVLIVSIPVSVCAASLSSGTTALRNQFKYGEGPKTDGYSVDYRYFSPVSRNDKTKYPLVIWFHGKNNGKTDGQQTKDIANWASDEFQSRFTSAGGAFILAPRAREELGLCWDADEMLAPLKAAVDSFIEKNKSNIDLNRIYIGGFSMGGMMTFKMLMEYPDMFAAAFPYCPASYLTKSMAKKFKNVPVWITSSNQDPTVDYDFLILNSWKSITSTSKVKGDCRLSTLTQVCYPDGTAADSNHYAWFAVSYDMFSSKGGNYPNMSTIDGNGNKVTLSHPEGMISWLTAHTSEYGKDAENEGGDSSSFFASFFDFVKIQFSNILASIKNAVASIFNEVTL